MQPSGASGIPFHAFAARRVLSVGMRIAAVLLAWSLAVIPAASAQSRTAALEWAVAQRSRYQTLQEPVVGVWATAGLANLVCPVDRSAAVGLFTDALGGLSQLTPQRFIDPRHVLPAPSFTALWKSVTANAKKCDPALEAGFDAERARGKMQSEQRNGNTLLRQAFSRIDQNPDRAGQLAETAISAADPLFLDIALLTQFLSQLRDRAADVADDVFSPALEMISSAEAPSPGLLMQLGNYLFVSRRLLTLDDKEENEDSFTASGVTIYNFQSVRASTIPDEVRDYIDAVIKVLTTRNQANYDPVAAYALAYQMLPQAEDLAPELADQLRQILPQIQSLAGAAASQIQSQLASSSGDPNSEDDAAKRARVMAAVFNAMGSGRFVEAREMNQGNSDIVSRNQVASLIDFAESAAAAGRKDTAWALSLANSLGPGVKRSILYAGIAAASRSANEALGPFQLALKDIEGLPAEQRMFTLAANAGAVFPADPDNGLMALGLLVAAANDAYANPHKGVFDPKVLRQYSKKALLGTDSPLILFNHRGLCEVVDTGQHRYNFSLRVPGAGALSLAGVLPAAHDAEPARLEALIVGLRDETLMAAGLNALAGARLSAGR